jgi:hypothetical protein
LASLPLPHTIEDRLMGLAAKAPLTRGIHNDGFYFPFGQSLGLVFEPEKAIMFAVIGVGCSVSRSRRSAPPPRRSSSWALSR